MTDDQSRRVWETLAEITERLRKLERDTEYGYQDPTSHPFGSSFWPGGAMDPELDDEPFWKYDDDDDDDMPPELRAMFEEMEEDNRAHEEGYDPDHPNPKSVLYVIGDYEEATGRPNHDTEFTEAFNNACKNVGLARQASGERAYLDLFSQAGRELRHKVSLDEIKLVNETPLEKYEAFPPLANLLRDVQQAYGNLRITDV